MLSILPSNSQQESKWVYFTKCWTVSLNFNLSHKLFFILLPWKLMIVFLVSRSTPLLQPKRIKCVGGKSSAGALECNNKLLTGCLTAKYCALVLFVVFSWGGQSTALLNIQMRGTTGKDLIREISFHECTLMVTVMKHKDKSQMYFHVSVVFQDEQCDLH